MSADDLRVLARKVRNDNSAIDTGLVDAVCREVEAYRAVWERHRSQRPPAELAEELLAMGWLIYEASIGKLWSIAPAFESLAGEKGERSRADAELIIRLADAARQLPWPEFAPRALGAIRAHALVESKRDTELGFDAAYIFHQEAREKQQSFIDSHGDDVDRDRYVLDLKEVLLQLALGETGTACRTAERVLGLWVEDFASDAEDSARWTQRMFRQLYDGVAIGEHALGVAKDIRDNHDGFVDHPNETRLAMPTAFRNPAIMTCRALLLVYSMCPEMEALGHDPVEPGPWTEFRAGLIKRFDIAFAYLRAPVRHRDGSDWPMLFDHLRSMVQLCLHLALLIPDHELEEELVVDDTLTLRRLDDAAVEAMSAWLATEVNGKPRGDANTIGSASKPSFIGSVEACRTDAGSGADYREWRRRWFRLDRYAGLDGRRERIDLVLSGGAVA